MRNDMIGIGQRRLRRWTGGVGLLLLASFFGAAAQAGGPAAEMETQGQIENVRIAAGQLVVDGRSYATAPDLTVSIGGTYGAFTMLKPGMRVYVRYLQFEDGTRSVVEVRELPANQRAEQS